MNESIQIVRKLLSGEPMPNFSTLDLLLGRAYMDPVVPKRAIEPEPEIEPKSRFDEFYERRRLFYAEERAKFAPVIREMLLQQKAKAAIAEEIGKSFAFLLKVIRSDAELTDLATKLPNVGAGVMKQRSNEKFAPYESAIEKWLREGRTYQFIADQVGVNKSTVCLHMDKHPHLRALCQRRRK